MGREGMEMAVTSMQITDVTWAPILTTQAVDNPFPKAAARPSCGNEHNKIIMYKGETMKSQWHTTICTAKIGNHQSRKKIVNSTEKK